MTRRRVVVTGLGIVSPVGIGAPAAWNAILHARSGVGPITRFDASSFPTRIAAEVKGFDVSAHLSAKEARRYDTFVHYGLIATMEAVKDAGLDAWPGDKERIGVCIGSGIGGLPMIEHTNEAYHARRSREGLLRLGGAGRQHVIRRMTRMIAISNPVNAKPMTRYPNATASTNTAIASTARAMVAASDANRFNTILCSGPSRRRI